MICPGYISFPAQCPTWYYYNLLYGKPKLVVVNQNYPLLYTISKCSYTVSSKEQHQCSLWPQTSWMSLDHWTCHFHFTYMSAGCRCNEMFRHVCVTATCAELSVAYCALHNLWDSTADLHLLIKDTSSSMMPNAMVEERKVSVASFMLTWKTTCPSGNTVLNMDSVWVPLQMPPRSCQTPNHCQCLLVWIHVSGCFCNVKAPEWRAAYLENAVWLLNKHKQWL